MDVDEQCDRLSTCWGDFERADRVHTFYDGEVWGVLYEGPDEAFAVLDTFQGDASVLEKSTVTVVGPDGPVEAFTYRLVQIANYVRPSDRYLTHITRAMKAQGLPPEAVEAVLQADRDADDTGPSISS